MQRGDDPALTAARRSSAAVSGGSDGSSIGCSVVMQMVRDAFANYVVQTTLDVVPESSDERRLLIQELNEHAEELVRCNQFAQQPVRNELASHELSVSPSFCSASTPLRSTLSPSSAA
jgi:hypothetical protein